MSKMLRKKLAKLAQMKNQFESQTVQETNSHEIVDVVVVVDEPVDEQYNVTDETGPEEDFDNPESLDDNESFADRLEESDEEEKIKEPKKNATRRRVARK